MRKKLLFSVVLLAVYMGIIFFLSSLPNEELEIEKQYNVRIDQSIKHLVEFGILGGLTMLVAIQLSDTFSSVFFSWVFSTSYGISDEIHQMFVPTRYCSVTDVWFNFVGSLIGVLLCLLILKIVRELNGRRCALHSTRCLPRR